MAPEPTSVLRTFAIDPTPAAGPDLLVSRILVNKDSRSLDSQTTEAIRFQESLLRYPNLLEMLSLMARVRGRSPP